MSGSKENRRRRGWILRILRLHTSAMNDGLILDALAEAGHQISMAILHGDLDYLSEKGYVEVAAPEMSLGFRVKVAKLTAKGIDVLEENISDPGIDPGHHQG